MSNIKLCFDLGSSDTKGVNLETNENVVVPNNICAVDRNMSLADYYQGEQLIDNIDVTIEKISGDQISLVPVTGANEDAEVMGDRYIIGALADQYSSVMSVAPVSTKFKTYQQTTYVNLLGNIAAEMYKANRTHCDVLLGVVLPPREYINQEVKKLFIKNISGCFRIRFNKTEQSVTVRIASEDVLVVSECTAALATFIFNLDGTLTDASLPYKTGEVIAVDGGRSTTDIALVRNLKPIVGSFHTVPFGGELVTDYINQYVTQQGITELPTDSMLELAVRTGFIKDGAKYVDISTIVNRAKQEYARRFFDEFMSYMKTHQYAPRNISALLYVGGLFKTQETGEVPSETSEVVNSAGIYVTKQYKSLSPNTDDIYIKDPRFANLAGLVRAMRAKIAKSAKYANDRAI